MRSICCPRRSPRASRSCRARRSLPANRMRAACACRSSRRRCSRSIPASPRWRPPFAKHSSTTRAGAVNMATLTTDDGVKLYYEETGEGTPIVFVHEFAGDWRSWEPQVRYFSRRYRCIVYSARGYLPSDVPAQVERYSQERWREDVRCVIDALKLPAAHVVGLSMGAFATLHFGMRYCNKTASPRALSLTLAGCGTGAHPAVHSKFQADAR